MSYKEEYHRSITVHGSKSESFSYPASQNGGSQRVTIHYTHTEPIKINVDVDTNGFDNSVAGCCNVVNGLTGSVIATKTAHVASIEKNAKIVANSIIDGFFQYIRSEMSQQTTELQQKMDAYLIHLRELSASCNAKKEQMRSDYFRISERYAKLFEDINNELSNRIHQLDSSTFSFFTESEKYKSRSLNSDLVNTVAISGAENSELLSKISVSFLKKRALDTINVTKDFLFKQKRLDKAINLYKLNLKGDSNHYAPTCFVETVGEDGATDRQIVNSDFMKKVVPKDKWEKIMEEFQTKSNSWKKMTNNQVEELESFFNKKVHESYPSNDDHSVRIKNMILSLAKLDQIQTTIST